MKHHRKLLWLILIGLALTAGFAGTPQWPVSLQNDHEVVSPSEIIPASEPDRYRNAEQGVLSGPQPITYTHLYPKAVTGLAIDSAFPLSMSDLQSTGQVKAQTQVSSTALAAGLSADRYQPTRLSTRDRSDALDPIQALATCTVSTIADSGPNSLRQCLLDALPGGTINFSTTTFPSTAPATISLSSPLPRILVDSLKVDASNAGVIIDGGSLPAGSTGLIVEGAAGVKIQGLQILNFPLDGIALIYGATNTTIGGDRSKGEGNIVSNNDGAGIVILHDSTTSNKVQGNNLGTDATGILPNGNSWGAVIALGAKDNLIGGASGNLRNIIGSNREAGIDLEGAGTTGNKVEGNYIGTNGTFLSLIGNSSGIVIQLAAKNNVIGGNAAGARNIISGNSNSGVIIEETGTTGNRVLGNYIGTNPAGTAAAGNNDGVVIGFGAQNNIIGGTSASDRNIISGNSDVGVQIQNETTRGNQVLGNYIGTNHNGQAGLPNFWGVLIKDAPDNIIGSAAAGAGNLISGNTNVGVQIENVEAVNNKVMGNLIGTNSQGTAALGNGDGVVIAFGARNNEIGGTETGARNLISGNNFAGVVIEGGDAGPVSGNQVLGNYIGTNVSGAAPVSNEFGVALISGAKDNTIGGATNGARNLISGNTEAGILIQGNGTTGNQVLGNYIGTNPTGATPVANLRGVAITIGAQNNIIGGTTTAARNLISGNTQVGILIQGHPTLVTMNNQALGNYIGVDVTGKLSLPNGRGIAIIGGAKDNIIGGTVPQARNLISGNSEEGILMQNAGTIGNQVRGNYIGTNKDGEASLPNFNGIGVTQGASDNTVGGTLSGTRNLISGNIQAGVLLQDEETTGNIIQGNYIGSDKDGVASIGNYVGFQIWFGASSNKIGGRSPGAGNLISGNTFVGIGIQKSGTSGNKVEGNKIGTDITGMTSLSNEIGVLITGASNNIVGAGNLISGNRKAGVQIQNDFEFGSESFDNIVLGNLIGTNLTGQAPLGNFTGVAIGFGAHDNTVGGETEGERNLISGNQDTGVLIQNLGTTGNIILGNYIGTNQNVTATVANQWGVGIVEGPRNNVVGGDSEAAGNVISGNANDGVSIRDAGDNQVRGNFIGSDVTGKIRLGNKRGVLLSVGAKQNTIGISNTIVFNDEAGIEVGDSTTRQNTITRNIIHSNGGLPIDHLGPEPISPIEIFYPSAFVITGTTCVNCTVEIYVNPDQTLAGTQYLGTTTANVTGHYSFTLSPPPTWSHPALTVTDRAGTTSEFYSDLFPPPPPGSATGIIYLPLIQKG